MIYCLLLAINDSWVRSCRVYSNHPLESCLWNENWGNNPKGEGWWLLHTLCKGHFSGIPRSSLSWGWAGVGHLLCTPGQGARLQEPAECREHPEGVKESPRTLLTVETSQGTANPCPLPQKCKPSPKYCEENRGGKKVTFLFWQSLWTLLQQGRQK